MAAPVSYSVTAKGKQVWSARQASGMSTLLLMNTDLNNTVMVGTDLTSMVVPIAPNGSLSVDPRSNWYVTGAVAGTGPLVVVPNGQSNFLGLTQGLGSLAIPSMFSPGFIPGLTGWSIQQNGNAEFNNLTIRGTFFGLDFIINSLGIFFYSGTPALGNLVGSWAPAAGANDGKGNAFLKDFTVYGVNGSVINVNSNGGIGGNPGVLFRPQSVTHMSQNPQIWSIANNNGLVNEFLALIVSSGKENGLDDAGFQFLSETADAAGAAVITAVVGGIVTFFTTKLLHTISVPVTATAGTAANPSLITTDVWHRVPGASLANNWVGSGGNVNGVLYRLTTDNMFEIKYDILNNVHTGTTVAVAFGGLSLNTNQNSEMWANSASPWAFFDTSGNFTIVNYSVLGKEVAGYFRVALGTLP